MSGDGGENNSQQLYWQTGYYFIIIIIVVVLTFNLQGTVLFENSILFHYCHCSVRFI
jgi:hypothetical protein